MKKLILTAVLCLIVAGCAAEHRMTQQESLKARDLCDHHGGVSAVTYSPETDIFLVVCTDENFAVYEVPNGPDEQMVSNK